MENPVKRSRFPWWFWLIVILFPIPFGVVHWWVTLLLLGLFVVLMWALTEGKDIPSE